MFEVRTLTSLVKLLTNVIAWNNLWGRGLHDLVTGLTNVAQGVQHYTKLINY